LFYEKRRKEPKQPIKNNNLNMKVAVTPRHDQASWNLMTAAFTNPATVDKLYVLGLRNSVPWAKIEKLKNDFTDQLRVHHVYVTPEIQEMQTRGDHELDAELKEWFSYCNQNDCTLILLRVKDYDKYATIKRASDFSGNHTICAIGSKIKDEKGRSQHFSNLALKVNMKMGGDNYWLDPGVLDKLLFDAKSKRRTMIMGS
jgi:hypothetical protein